MLEIIIEKIKKMAQNYHAGYLLSAYGNNMRDILDERAKHEFEEYQNEILPMIDRLSTEEKYELILKLDGLNEDKSMSSEIIGQVLDYVEQSKSNGRQ